MAVLGLTGEVAGYVYLGQQTPAFYAKQVVASLVNYGRTLLPPFFGGLMAYDGEANIAFDCPGHQGGQFYRKSPAGQLFFKYFGESIFRNDLCNADVDLGDLLIHEGPAVEAQRHAAKVFGADQTYFVLNGTSTSNKVVTNALLKRGDLVLFDRNNHKSLIQGALVQAGAIPIFLPTARNSFGMIGAVDWDAWDEASLRERIRAQPLVKDKDRAKAERPFRLACIQLATYDGTVYNVRKVMEKIGHLCDYVLWDEAWIGYNAFHPLFEDHSPMRLENLGPEMPGLFSTQSVHKQGAGFSQASQIHKRDEHIRGQRRYVEHKRFNESFLIDASTSPFYPLFASLDVNAKIHEGKAGEMLWDRCIELGIEARKKFREFGRHYAKNGRDDAGEVVLRPLRSRRRDDQGARSSPRTSTDTPWEDLPTEVIKREQQCWNFAPKSTWHGYAGYSDGYAMVDPNKLTLLTPGIDRKTGDYLDFGVPATVVANYLREQRVVPEKCDLNSVLFLMTPAEDESKLNTLIAKLVKFKNLWDRDAPLNEVLPTVFAAQQRTLRRLHAAPDLQRDARLLSPGECQGAAAPVLPRVELPRARDVAEGRLRGARRQRGRLRAAHGDQGAHLGDPRADLSAGHRRRRPGRALGRQGASPCSTTSWRSRNRSTASPASTTKSRASTRSASTAGSSSTPTSSASSAPRRN